MKYYGIQNEVKAYINRLQDENNIYVSPSTVKTINDRVEGLKRSGDWSRFSLGFNDVDGDAYLTRANVNDAVGRCEVLWFTRGMKALNLWNNTVCWPTRSYQNAGTGSTVFSLGGLGIFNGTAFNSPTWGADGLTFNQTSGQSVRFNSEILIDTEYTFSLTTRFVSTSTTNLVAGAAGWNRGSYISCGGNGDFRLRMGAWTAASAWTGNQFASLTDLRLWNVATATGNDSSLQFYNNTSSWYNALGDYRRTSNGLLPTMGNFNSSVESYNISWNGNISFMFLSSLYSNQARIRSMYNLYKSTLGNGLGLP
jgi:hypothetical protein